MLKSRPSRFKKAENFSILIVCEDTRSAVYYLNAKIKKCGLSKTTTVEKTGKDEIAVDVEGSKKGSAPISVVDYAIGRRDKYNKEAQKEGRYPYKEVYCAMDVDDHDTLNKAINKIHSVNRDKKDIADSKLIHIVSNENFEVWYLFHFEQYSTKELYRKPSGKQRKYVPDARRIDKRLENYLHEDYSKADKDIFQLIEDNGGNEENAIKNARKLEEEHYKHSPDKPPYLSNPSTEVYKLINRLNGLEKERKPVNPSEIGKITQTDLKKSDYLFREDDFTNTLLDLVNKHYPGRTKAEKIDILADMFKKPHNNTACYEHDDIAVYFYQNIGKIYRIKAL